MPYPDIARGLVENAIQGYLGRDAAGRFKKKLDAVKKEIDDFRVKTKLDEALRTALKQLEDEEE